ncbi:MAG: hypothetical protein A2Z91_08515 [Deltaproteobacteria bacterium GWA2_38_16]|nr:MAG: hypothetical protein A2Z91_08515 [Deltaproteobacteria bacterium GWA2_38_16]OGQ03836.1 MAG: hypothetical protein A3D19_07080 [Deltaproteobacteria bacterium RIFCSPHIGHO2_02_FULL_38_15]OGQ31506.1 MAG: hypothetical protein A3A72_09230 [Deltaproteobacteria bacterium RIFCSPLOWO2_01_FULL_38_9]OGQ63923.1 MAG: hypothetical protein A3G92_08045 [Deltaproteobacteria bacterium RIFCSPLOWO2_12_FULL_38_8]HBQ20881.1 hypothetical protein [Deltaproteobacteria bacterium]
MKKIIVITGIGISSLFLISGSLQAMNVGYADIQQAIQSVKAGKNAKERVEKEVAKRKKTLDKMRGEIEKLEADFKKQELVLSEESKQKKRAEYTKKVQELQESVSKNQQEMQQEEQKALAPILDKMSDVLKKLSKEKGYDMVVMKGALLYAEDSHDLTSELIKAFDKEYKK